MPSSRSSHATTRPSWFGANWTWIVFAILTGLAGAMIASALRAGDIANFGQWAIDFSKSSGLAGLFALMAALLAYVGISRQVGVARSSLAHQEDAARDGSWWARLEWISAKAIPSSQSDQIWPRDLTIATIQGLSDTAIASVQQTACKGMIDLLTGQVEVELSSKAAESGAQDSSAVKPGPVVGNALRQSNSPSIGALSSYARSNRGTPAASAMAEALVFESEVMNGLATLNRTNPRVFRTPPDGHADAIALRDGRQLLIEIKWSSSVESLLRSVIHYVDVLRSRDVSDPVLIIGPYELNLPQKFHEADARYIAWSETGGPQAVAAQLE